MTQKSLVSTSFITSMKSQTLDIKSITPRCESFRSSFSPFSDVEISLPPKICKTPEPWTMMKNRHRRLTLDEFCLSPNSPDVISYDESQRVCDTVLPSEPTLIGVRTIDLSTLKQVIKDHVYVEIIDCRYPYEYNAGHIKGALNLWNEDLLLNHFPIEKDLPQSPSILLFYCEFSGTRAPALARHFRRTDQHSCNPYLIYKEVYLIDKGLCEVFEHYNEICEGEYIEMNDERFVVQKKECSRIVAYIRKGRQVSSPRHSNITPLSLSANSI
ncbi:rodhanase-like domain containing protein [Entamoeba histolytica]|nr:rodhanase-like domain containing protein [Entamoeba histolytica]